MDQASPDSVMSLCPVSRNLLSANSGVDSVTVPHHLCGPSRLGRSPPRGVLGSDLPGQGFTESGAPSPSGSWISDSGGGNIS